MTGQVHFNGRRLMDLSGQRFGRLQVIRIVRATSQHAFWECVCDCGSITQPAANKLRRGTTRSCGCQKREEFGARSRKHGMKTHTLYNCWTKIRARCSQETDPAFQNYGGRGIKVCPRWVDGEGGLTGFECFVLDMGERPSRRHSLERRDNDKGYEPGNVVWGTPKDQARNRRSNRIVRVDGQPMALSAACERLGLDFQFINGRIQHGFTFERAITQPKRIYPRSAA